MVLWPIPCRFALQSQGAPRSRTITFPTDSGIPVSRVHITARTEVWSIVTVPFETAVIDQFEAWFDYDLGAGVQKFVMPRPTTDAFHLWRFVQAEQPYTVTTVSIGLHRITCSLLMLPNGVDPIDYQIDARRFLWVVP